MKKRQLRLSGEKEIKQGLPKLVSRQISLVMLDNTTVFGVLVRLSDSTLHLKNMRLANIDVPIDHIAEVFSDFE